MDTEINELPKKENTFAKGINFYKIFWIFFICSFLGVVVELIWCLIKNGTFESRSALVLLPLNPVYGLGAIIMTLFFHKFNHKKNIVIFFICMLIGGTFEYICNLFQELAFGTVSWSYTPQLLGVFRRTSLLYSLFWGLLGLLWVEVLDPFLSNAIEKLPNKTGKILTCFFLLALIIDITFSSYALHRQQQRRQGIAATIQIQRFFDTYVTDDLLKQVYPNMKPVK